VLEIRIQSLQRNRRQAAEQSGGRSGSSSTFFLAELRFAPFSIGLSTPHWPTRIPFRYHRHYMISHLAPSLQETPLSFPPIIYQKRTFKTSCDRHPSHHPIRYSILLDLYNFTKRESVDKSEKEIEIRILLELPLVLSGYIAHA